MDITTEDYKTGSEWMAAEKEKKKAAPREATTDYDANSIPQESLPVEDNDDLHVPEAKEFDSTIDGAMYYGIIGELIRRIEPHSEADPIALLFDFLSRFGNLMGRGPHFRAGEQRHFLKLWGVFVGESFTGKKGSSAGPVDYIIGQIVNKAPEVMNGLSSGEGLIHALRDPIMDGGVETDAGVSEKRMFIREEEFARVLTVMKREGNILSMTLRSAWDDKTLQNMTKSTPDKASNTHISIIAHITPQELQRVLRYEDIYNGGANRFLWFYVKGSKLLSHGGNLREVNFDDLIPKLKAALEFARGCSADFQSIEFDDNAKPEWGRYYNQLHSNYSGRSEVEAIMGRSLPNTRRIACIYAIADRSRVVRIEHLKAAIAIVKYADKSVRHLFVDLREKYDPIAEKIIAGLEANPEGLTTTDISNIFGRNVPSKEIKSSLKKLLDKGVIRSDPRKTTGRPAQVWSLRRTEFD